MRIIAKKTFILHYMRLILLALFGLIYLPIGAQIGGYGVFTLPKQAANARQLGWCGYNASYANRDVTAALSNPALLCAENIMRPAANINSQVPGVWSGNAGMGFEYKNVLWSGQFMFINFGKFDTYDAGGNPTGTGTTNANEMLMALSSSKQLNKQWNVGASLKVVYSVLGPYIANGAMIDAGVHYKSKDSTYTIGASLNNFGSMITTYNSYEKMPMGLQIGTTIKPKHMPFRFNLTLHNLQKWDLTYNQYIKSNNLFDTEGGGFEKEVGFGGKLLRHFTFGGELVLGKNFGILMGYNHQRRMEMAPTNKKGITGMGWGIDLKLNRFNLTYASAGLFPGYNFNMFTISTHLEGSKKIINSQW